MIGLDFEVQAPVVAPDPNRADIACFVGFVGRRETAVPGLVWHWLEEQGWTSPIYRLPKAELDARLEVLKLQHWTPPPYQRSKDDLDGLIHLPVPIDSWEVFDFLFAWDERPLTGSANETRFGATYLGAAVRSFFAQGGRKCYVVRVGDPWPLVGDRSLSVEGRRARRAQQLLRLIPGFALLPEEITGLPAEEIIAGPSRVSPLDREGWRNLDHLFGLPEVSFLCLPDLADAIGTEPVELTPARLPVAEEQFVECTEPVAESQDGIARLIQAPRADEQSYKTWARALYQAATLVAAYWREVQLVAAVPIPVKGINAERDLLASLINDGVKPLAQGREAGPFGLASAFVQLVYPWARTPGSSNLPERLESPEGMLAGALARNALFRGAYRSAANLPLADVYDLFPLLPRNQLLSAHPDSAAATSRSHSLLERVSLGGPTPGGWRLLSDVTTSLDESYRPACINRLMSAIVRAARRLGEDLIFEPSSERLWTQLRDRMNGLLSSLYQAGALGGASPAEAFDVRCDRTTMTQNDIDNGRVIVRIEFLAAAPIERITVVLAMSEGGQLSLVSGRGTSQEAT